MSDSPISRPRSLSQDEVDKIIVAMRNRGAQLNISDPRVTKATQWMIGILGLTAVSMLGWLANSVNQLATGLTENTAELRAANKRFDDFKSDYNDERQELRARLASLEHRR